jgi:hypothetical protein
VFLPGMWHHEEKQWEIWQFYAGAAAEHYNMEDIYFFVVAPCMLL